jgi:hypothetical protein
MIIDTHFHAFPGNFLKLMPEAQQDVRGVKRKRGHSELFSQLSFHTDAPNARLSLALKHL